MSANIVIIAQTTKYLFQKMAISKKIIIFAE